MIDLKEVYKKYKSILLNKLAWNKKILLEKSPDLPEPNIHKIVIIGMTAIILFFGAAVIWAGLAPLETGAVMPGRVIVETYRKEIQHRYGGIVKAIYVDDGSQVNAGDTLIVLDDTKEKAYFELLRQEQIYLKARLARLIAERDNAQTITFPPDLLTNESDPKVKAAMDGEMAIFHARTDLLKKTISVLSDKIEQLKNEINSFRAQATSADKQLVLINEETKAVAYLEAKHIVDRPRLLALKRAQAKLTGDRDDFLASVAQSEQKIGEVNLQIIQIEQQNIKEIVESLQQIQADLVSNQEKLSAAEDTYRRTIIKAPITGTIVGLKIHTIGGVISPGETLMEIVPKRDRLVIEARVNPLDIDAVRIGLETKILFVAFPRRSTPILNGVISEVSADVYTDEKTNQMYYTAKVEISSKELARLGNEKVYPGMPVEVLAVTNKKTFFGYLIQPIRNSLFKAFREQ